MNSLLSVQIHRLHPYWNESTIVDELSEGNHLEYKNNPNNSRRAVRSRNSTRFPEQEEGEADVPDDWNNPNHVEDHRYILEGGTNRNRSFSLTPSVTTNLRQIPFERRRRSTD